MDLSTEKKTGDVWAESSVSLYSTGDATPPPPNSSYIQELYALLKCSKKKLYNIRVVSIWGGGMLGVLLLTHTMRLDWILHFTSHAQAFLYIYFIYVTKYICVDLTNIDIYSIRRDDDKDCVCQKKEAVILAGQDNGLVRAAFGTG